MQNRLNHSSIPDYPHSISTSAYMRLVFTEWLLSRGWLIALPIAAIAFAAWKTGDLRLWVVVPVLVCLIVPLILVMLYYSYALTPEAISAVRPHKTRLSADGSLTLIPEPDPESGRSFPELKVAANDIETVDERADRFIIHIKNKHFRFIIIPKIQPQDENF